jgi:tRNA (guanosine-2'-O-)-methyltransferase
LRSAEAFGAFEVHVVGPSGAFRAAHAVARGAHRWLELVRHDDPAACAASLQARGYRVLVAQMGGEATPAALREIPRAAVVFGNEHRGASAVMRAAADGTYAIPMRGFVESLNVSVAGAITLFAATDGRDGGMADADRARLLARYLLDDVRDAERIVLGFVAERDGASP